MDPGSRDSLLVDHGRGSETSQSTGLNSRLLRCLQYTFMVEKHHRDLDNCFDSWDATSLRMWQDTRRGKMENSYSHRRLDPSGLLFIGRPAMGHCFSNHAFEVICQIVK